MRLRRRANRRWFGKAGRPQREQQTPTMGQKQFLIRLRRCVRAMRVQLEQERHVCMIEQQRCAGNGM